MRTISFICIILFLNCFTLYPQKIDFVAKGQNLIEQNKLDDAILYFNSNLKNALNDEQRIFLFFGLADAYKLKIEYNKSKEYYLKAFQLIQNTNNSQLQFLYNVKMAEFFRKRRMPIDALKQLDEAKSILKKNKIEYIYLVKYYSRKAALFGEYYKNTDSTLYYANKSLALAKKIDNKDIIFYSQLEIAGVYEFKEEYKKAIPYLESIIKFARENKLVQQEADAYINYVKVLGLDDQLEKALQKAKYAADFAKRNKLYLNELTCYSLMHDIYFRLNNTEKAYEILKIKFDLNEKYNSLKKEELLVSLEAKYKFKENENEIKISKLEIANKNKKLAANKINFLITVCFLAIVLFLAGLILYFLKKSKKSNKQLQFLSKQNEFLVSEANHRINNNLQLIIVLIHHEIAKSTKKGNKKVNRILVKIDAVATLHKHLYKNKNKENVDIKNYLSDIQTNFQSNFIDQNIQINFNIQPHPIQVDLAMYLGLLLTELIINSLKHAFGNQTNKAINFILEIHKNTLHFKYSDNGSGTDKKVALQLIDQLCQQMKISYELDTTNKFLFTFTIEI